MKNKPSFFCKLVYYFNGSRTGRETTHRVTTAEGVARVLHQNTGKKFNGHGARVYLYQDQAIKLGAYQSADGCAWLPCPSWANPMPIDFFPMNIS